MSAPPPTPSEPRPRRWRRALLIAAGLLATLGGATWAHPRGRHLSLLALTALERRTSAAPGAPPGVGPEASAHWVHAAWIDSSAPLDAPSDARRACAEFRGVELDVLFSADHVPYLGHDEAQAARALGHPELRLGARSAAELDALRPAPLRLEQLLAAARCEVLVLDLKTTHEAASAKAAALAAALRGRRGPVWVVSRSGPVLSALRALRPDLRYGCEGYLAWGNALAGFDLLSLDRADLTPARDARARALGQARLYWTARDPASLAELQAWRPEALLFDAPGLPPASLPADVRLEQP